MQIIVEKRQDDYIAYLEEFPEFWGCGNSSKYAIGDLMNTHNDYFKIPIRYEGLK